MQTPILMPDLGTAPGERVVLSVWFADEGDEVLEGDRLVEVLLAGTTFDIPAPATGILVERRSLPDDPLTPGQVVGVVQSPSGNRP